MNLHEYQGKALFKDYGLPTTQFTTAQSVDEVRAACESLTGERWVAKAQVHAGGRGKAGGVKVCDSVAEVEAFTKKLLGTNLVTYQTTEEGQPVNTILIEETSEIKSELYLGAVVDRATRGITFIASTEGGVEIEKVAHETPEKIHHAKLQPLVGAMPFHGRALAFALGLEGKQVRQFTQIVLQLAKLFVEKDLALIEINPLIINQNDDLICLDAKINVDSNAQYRQSVLWQMQDTSQEDARELEAAKHQLNYVALDGSIGCMVNGAGLAMATMDIIKLYGGDPANFLDVGGGATAARVTEAFKLILSDDKVKAILINIFGGIVRCDLIAEGIIQAVKEVKPHVPIVVRLEGNNHEKGLALLDESGMDIITAVGLAQAAEKAVASVAKS